MILFFILLIFSLSEKKYIFLSFDKIILQLGIGLLGLSLPLKFNNQAMFSGALINILLTLNFLILLTNLLILESTLSPEILFSKV